MQICPAKKVDKMTKFFFQFRKKFWRHKRFLKKNLVLFTKFVFSELWIEILFNQNLQNQVEIFFQTSVDCCAFKKAAETLRIIRVKMRIRIRLVHNSSTQITKIRQKMQLHFFLVGLKILDICSDKSKMGNLKSSSSHFFPTRLLATARRGNFKEKV